jgi:ABC-type nitrate/sulfonate/bicarbonate transport system substrate-binding protein
MGNKRVSLSLLRGICQLPAYIAHERGYWSERGIEVTPTVEATAWLIPDRLLREEQAFAVMPWTRVAASGIHREPFVLICGSGCDEAAIVLRRGVRPEEVREVAVPQQGGIKDLTAAASFDALGWKNVESLRFPSGDAAILCLVGGGADAAVMVEPYATMVEQLGLGTVVLRTGDIWSGVPGCSLTTTAQTIERSPELVHDMVEGFVRGARDLDTDPEGSSKIAARYIGMAPAIIQSALAHNRPNMRALENEKEMARVVKLMIDLGYLPGPPPEAFKDLKFLREVLGNTKATA